MTGPAAPTPEQLRAHLVTSRLAGDVATSRENNLANYRRMSQRDPRYLFGLHLQASWTLDEVLALMAERCGVSPDPGHTEGQDTIDPDRTLDRLNAMADRLAKAAASGDRVLVATGHPVGLRPTHTGLAGALRRAGCTVLTPVPDWRHPVGSGYGEENGPIAFIEGVGVLLDATGVPTHTHSPLPMEAILSHLGAHGEEPPDLVVADHGWAGAAGQRGIDAVGFADSNDPALFVGEAEGRILATVPLDDNVDPRLYAPLTAYLLARAGLTQD